MKIPIDLNKEIWENKTWIEMNLRNHQHILLLQHHLLNSLPFFKLSTNYIQQKIFWQLLLVNSFFKDSFKGTRNWKFFENTVFYILKLKLIWRISYIKYKGTTKHLDLNKESESTVFQQIFEQISDSAAYAAKLDLLFSASYMQNLMFSWWTL